MSARGNIAQKEKQSPGSMSNQRTKRNGHPKYLSDEMGHDWKPRTRKGKPRHKKE